MSFIALLASTMPIAEPGALVRYAGVTINAEAERIASIDSRQAVGAFAAGHGSIVVRDTSGKVVARYDPCDKCSYAGLSWSPDGAALAFVASEAGQATLYVADGGGARVVTTLSGLLATPRWSPDGRSIAILATKDATKETGPSQAGPRMVGALGRFKDSRRIAVVAQEGGELRFVSPDGGFIYEYDWTPEGRAFVATAADGDGDNQWYVADLRHISVDGDMRIIASPSFQLNSPRVSPDGKTVTFIAGLMSDFGAVGGDIYSVPIHGGTPKNLTVGFKGSFSSVQWRGDRMIATAIIGGSLGILTLERTGGLRLLSETDETCEAADGRIALDGQGMRAAAVCETFRRPPAIHFGGLRTRKKITIDNDHLKPKVAVRDIRWQSEGREIQGWLLSPQSGETAFDGEKHPLITIVHGGPAVAAIPRFPWSDPVDFLTSEGYWLFQPNPRGSLGQGTEFVAANKRDFGGGDFRDIDAGLDAVISQEPVDPERLGIFGHSYGGFMTMWAVAHSTRFKAAVAGAGISDWVSYYGQTGISQWMPSFFGVSAYDNPAIYDRLSPARKIKSATTPTLLYVGERDIETPPPQSLQFWRGLTAAGVPSDLVVYPDEGHTIRNPENLRDRRERMLDWFNRYLSK